MFNEFRLLIARATNELFFAIHYVFLTIIDKRFNNILYRFMRHACPLTATGRSIERDQRRFGSGKRRSVQPTADVGRDREHPKSPVRTDGKRKMA